MPDFDGDMTSLAEIFREAFNESFGAEKGSFVEGEYDVYAIRVGDVWLHPKGEFEYPYKGWVVFDDGNFAADSGRPDKIAVEMEKISVIRYTPKEPEAVNRYGAFDASYSPLGRVA